MLTAVLTTGNVLAGIAYDPTIRGLLAVGVGILVLMGSVYLLLATNNGNRLGFLLALTGLFGWMTIMGVIWWIYGIGMKGEAPSWKVVEYNAADLSEAATDKATHLDLSVLPMVDGHPDYEGLTTLSEEDPEQFNQIENRLEEASDGWEFLAPSNPARGEAEATVAAQLPECSSCAFGIENASDYKVLGAFEVGGKKGLPDDPNRWDRIRTQVVSALTIKNPKRYAIVQVQKVIPQEAEPGQPPPLPVVDPDQPVISVVMLRNIGDLRFPSAVVTISSGLVFGLLCWVLHQRERILQDHLAQAEAAGAGA